MYDEKTIATAYKITMYLYKLHVLLWQIFNDEFRQFRKQRRLKTGPDKNTPSLIPFCPSTNKLHLVRAL